MRCLDAKSFQPLLELESPRLDLIIGLAFDPSGSRLAAATIKPFVQLWDLRLMRRELAELGLDWEPGITHAVEHGDSREPSGISKGRVAPGTSIWLPLAGVALCVLLSVFVLRRHQKLVEGYRRIDDLAVQRSRELEAAQAELLHSEKMKALGTLAAGVAHDFNNLLSVIRLSNDIVGEETKSLPSGYLSRSRPPARPASRPESD